MPTYLQTVKPTQLAHPLFQFGAVASALVASITELDVISVSSASFAAAALALTNLPSLRILTLCFNLLAEIGPLQNRSNGSRDATVSIRRDLGSRAFKANKSKIVELRVKKIPSDHDMCALQELEPFAVVQSIRRISLGVHGRRVGQVPPACGPLLPLLLRLTNVQDITIDDDIEGRAFPALMLEAGLKGVSVTCTALRSLKLTTMWDPPLFFFIHEFAPNLERLDLTLTSAATNNGEDPDDPPPFPRLTHLRLSGVRQCSVALAYADFVDLSSLEIFLEHPPHGIVDCDDLIPYSVVLPAGLRLHLRTHTLTVLKDLDILEQRCRNAHVVFTHDKHSPLTAFATAKPSVMAWQGPAREAAVDEALVAARDRLSRMTSTEDKHGVLAMAQGLRKVAEGNLLASL